jgi:hypothetical protein
MMRTDSASMPTKHGDRWQSVLRPGHATASAAAQLRMTRTGPPSRGQLSVLACQWSLEISGRSMPNRKIGRARHGRQRLTGAATEEGR